MKAKLSIVIYVLSAIVNLIACDHIDPAYWAEDGEGGLGDALEPLYINHEEEPPPKDGFFGEPETHMLFDPAKFETPASLIFDRFDNGYMTLAMTGEVIKITPEFERVHLASMPLGIPCEDPMRRTGATGLTIDRDDNLYVAVYACEAESNGLWKVDVESGEMTLLATVPMESLLNGIEYHRGYIYGADSFQGLIWRIPEDGGQAEVWADHPLLKPIPGVPAPGPNGIKYFLRKMYVAVSVTANMVEIPVNCDGTAGEPSVYATLPKGEGCDEFAFDVFGRMYCTTDPFNSLVRIDRDGTAEVLLTKDDLLSNPTSVAFGRRGWNRWNLYIANGGFPWSPDTPRPSLMSIQVDAPGVYNWKRCGWRSCDWY